MDDIDLGDYKVTSEVHVFSEGEEISGGSTIVVSNFKFTLPIGFLPPDSISNNSTKEKLVDEDGDLLVPRRNQTSDYSLAIKHHVNTSLDLVGLQVWRGALLLADYLLHSSLPENQIDVHTKQSDHIIELGAGTGLTSIVAGMVAEEVISTDVNKGNILSLIETNTKLNEKWIKGQVHICELNFYQTDYPPQLVTGIEKANIVIAADVIYHDDLTDAFLRSLKRIMGMGRDKVALISLEKRFVFTINDMDVGAPCFDYFHENLTKEFSSWKIELVDTCKLPQYFCYERAKELVLFKISKKQ